MRCEVRSADGGVGIQGASLPAKGQGGARGSGLRSGSEQKQKRRDGTAEGESGRCVRVRVPCVQSERMWGVGCRVRAEAIRGDGRARGMVGGVWLLTRPVQKRSGT